MKLSTWNWISVPRVARRIDSCEKVIKPGRRAQRRPEQRNAIFCHCSPSRQRNRFFFLPLFFLFFFFFSSLFPHRYATDGGQQRARVSTYSTANGVTISLVFALCLLPGARLFNEKQRVTKNFQGMGQIFFSKCLSIIDFIRPLMGETCNYSEDSRDSSFNFFSTDDFSSFCRPILSPLKRDFVISRVCIFTTYATTGKLFPNISSYPYCVPGEFGIIVFHPF